jgi:hypothetical protein
MLIANDGPLRALHLGRGQSSFTIAKSWSSWVFASDVSAEHLVAFLLPTLIGVLNAAKFDSQAFTNN